MTRRLPTDQQAMNLILHETAGTGRRATITAVERRLGVPHPTFYRNYPHLIDWFKQQVQDHRAAPGPETTARRTDSSAQIAELRRENEDLRRRVRIYAEALRQLTLDHAQLQTKVIAQARVTDLDDHRRHRPPPGSGGSLSTPTVQGVDLHLGETGDGARMPKPTVDLRSDGRR